MSCVTLGTSSPSARRKRAARTTFGDLRLGFISPSGHFETAIPDRFRMCSICAFLCLCHTRMSTALHQLLLQYLPGLAPVWEQVAYSSLTRREATFLLLIEWSQVQVLLGDGSASTPGSRSRANGSAWHGRCRNARSPPPRRRWPGCSRNGSAAASRACSGSLRAPSPGWWPSPRPPASWARWVR